MDLEVGQVITPKHNAVDGGLEGDIFPVKVKGMYEPRAGEFYLNPVSLGRGVLILMRTKASKKGREVWVVERVSENEVAEEKARGTIEI
jgi:hypothetical protein